MLNEFYEFIAKKVNSFFQKAASDGTLLKGESFCLKLDNDDMVAKVSSALKHLAEENKIIGIYELVCRDNSVYKTYTLKVKNDEVIIAAQIDGMTNDFLCATLRNAANSMQKSLLMISSNPIDSAKSGSNQFIHQRSHSLHHDHEAVPAFIHILYVFTAEITPVQNKANLLITISKSFVQHELKL